MSDRISGRLCGRTLPDATRALLHAVGLGITGYHDLIIYQRKRALALTAMSALPLKCDTRQKFTIPETGHYAEVSTVALRAQ